MSELVRVAPGLPAPFEDGAQWEQIFEVWMDSKRYSANTRDAYRRHLGLFMAFAARRGVYGPDRITPALLVAFRRALEDSDCSDSTRNQARAAVAGLVRFCRLWRGGQHLPDKDQMAGIFGAFSSRGKRPYQVLHPSERDALLEAAAATTGARAVSRGLSTYTMRTRRPPERVARDRAILLLALGCGLRVSEMASGRNRREQPGLRLEDLRQEEAGLEITVLGKGRKTRTVPVPEDSADALVEYLKITGRRVGRDEGPLFLGARGRGITYRAVNRILESLIQQAGLQKHISPHSLRHTCAIECLRHGMDVASVSLLLGHESIETTRIYLDHLRVSDLRRKMPLATQRSASPPKRGTS